MPMVVELLVFDVALGPVVTLAASLLTAANCAAIWAAMLESTGVRTEPVSTMALPAISLWMLEPGIRRVSN